MYKKEDVKKALGSIGFHSSIQAKLLIKFEDGDKELSIEDVIKTLKNGYRCNPNWVRAIRDELFKVSGEAL